MELELQSDPAMKIREAIGKAQWYRSQPEVCVDDKTAKTVIDTLLSALQQSRCYFNAVQRGQRTFVLVEQDRAAVEAIRRWADLAEQHGCPHDKVSQARMLATSWEAKPQTETKWPD